MFETENKLPLEKRTFMCLSPLSPPPHLQQVISEARRYSQANFKGRFGKRHLLASWKDRSKAFSPFLQTSNERLSIVICLGNKPVSMAGGGTEGGKKKNRAYFLQIHRTIQREIQWPGYGKGWALIEQLLRSHPRDGINEKLGHKTVSLSSWMCHISLAGVHISPFRLWS